MHPRVLAERSVAARQRITASLEILVKAYGLNPEMLDQLHPGGSDPDVRAMKEQEAMADVLDSLQHAHAAGVKKAKKGKAPVAHPRGSDPETENLLISEPYQEDVIPVSDGSQEGSQEEENLVNGPEMPPAEGE